MLASEWKKSPKNLPKWPHFRTGWRRSHPPWIARRWQTNKPTPPAPTSSPPDFRKGTRCGPSSMLEKLASSVPDGPRFPFPIPTRSQVHSTQPTGTPPCPPGSPAKTRRHPPLNIEINNITRPHHSCLRYKHTQSNIFVLLTPIYSRRSRRRTSAYYCTQLASIATSSHRPRDHTHTHPPSNGTDIMSSSSNSFLRGQRKSDLLELAETVGLEKYIQSFSLVKFSRLPGKPFATREPASRPGCRFTAGPAGGAVSSRPSRTAVLRLSSDARCRYRRSFKLLAVSFNSDHPVTNMLH